MCNVRLAASRRRLSLLSAAAVSAMTLLPGAADASPSTQRLSLDANGGQISAGIDSGAMTNNGRYVALVTRGPLASSGQGAPPGPPGPLEVYLRDRVTGQLELISKASDGTPADGDSGNPRVSENGRYVAYYSKGTNLTGDPHGSGATYLFDRTTGTTSLIQHAPGAAGTDTKVSDMTPDGRYFAVITDIPVDAGDHNGSSDAVLYDRVTGTYTPITNGSSGSVDDAKLSNDGSRVIVMTTETLTSDDTDGGSADVYLWESGSLRLINTKSDGSDPDASARMADISGDGRYVVFESSGDYTDDASDRDDSSDDVYRKDLQTGSVKLVSIADGGAQITDSEAALPDNQAITDDGRYVIFQAMPAPAIAPLFFRRDMNSNTVIKATVADDGSDLDDASYDGWISGDGRRVLFRSTAGNAVTGDTNNQDDLFMRTLESPLETTVTSGPIGTISTADAELQFNSDDASATFECQLDAGPWQACTSPKTLTGLADGTHTFGVRAVNAVGEEDWTPASRIFTVAVQRNNDQQQDNNDQQQNNDQQKDDGGKNDTVQPKPPVLSRLLVPSKLRTAARQSGLVAKAIREDCKGKRGKKRAACIKAVRASLTQHLAFKLDRAAKVTVMIEQRNGMEVASMTVNAKGGTTTIAWTGKLGEKTIKAGKYRIVLTATADGTASRASHRNIQVIS